MSSEGSGEYRLVGASHFSGYFPSGSTVIDATQEFQVIDESDGHVAQLSYAIRYVLNPYGTVVVDYNRAASTCTRWVDNGLRLS